MTLFTFNKAPKLSKISRLVEKYSLSAASRRAEKDLNRLSDRQLEDMGMSRGDLYGKAWGNF